jgi:hypothetical protein
VVSENQRGPFKASCYRSLSLPLFLFDAFSIIREKNAQATEKACVLEINCN